MALYDFNSALQPYSFGKSASAGLWLAGGIKQLQDLASKRRNTMALSRAMRGDMGAMADINDPEMLAQAQRFQRQQALRGFYNPVDQNVVVINTLETIANAKPRGFDLQGATDYMLSQGASADEISPLLKLAELRKSQSDQYGNTLTAAVDDQGNLVYLQPGGPTGARPIQGFRPPEGVSIIDTGNERVIVGSRTGREQQRMPVQVDPTAIYTQGEQTRRTIMQPQLEVQAAGEKAKRAEIGRAEGESIVERGQQVEKAQNAIGELQNLKVALSKLPSPARLRVEGAKAFFGLENRDIQSALGEVERISGRMLEYVNRLPGAATDADRQIFMASAGVITDPNATASRKIAGAESAIQSYQRLIQKYGQGQRQSQPRSIAPAATWLKSRNLQTQQQFNTAVQQLRQRGWSEAEIRQAVHEAGL